MSGRIDIEVPGPPVGQPRVKASHGGGFTKVYTPTTRGNGQSNGIAEYKAGIRIAWQQTQALAFSGPVALIATFIFPRTKGQTWKTKPMPRLPHDKKPDIDNVLKAVQDALNGLAYADDSQIVRVEITKVVAAGDEQPRTLISVAGA